ncbi:MAG: AraC family transcriptional regulator [Ruminococcaceae bacterium]|nr:AraC family transcriptional regulator [Oscillospiraceae bacterium]
MSHDFREAHFIVYSFEKRNYVPALKKSTIPYLDLTLCIEGTMDYIIDEKRVVLEAGDAIIFPPGSTRTRAFTNKKNYYASFNIKFSGEFASPLCGKVKNCIFPDTLTILELFKRNFIEPSLFKDEKCRGIFSYLFHQILESSMNKENSYVKKTKQYIISNLSQNLNLEMISKEVHLEPHYLCALFKEHTGTTIMQYIISLRIENAKHLIMTQDDKIYKISEKCGFANYNHFSNTFKKITGITAAQYRKLTK